MAGTKRDLKETTKSLETWFAARMGQPATVSELTIPKAGFSNETLLGKLTMGAEDLHFVVRIEPTGHQLFLEPDALFQSAMMKALASAKTVPVPTVLFEEPDPTVLGSPFFVMKRVFGRVPSDTPTWHAGGWTKDLSPLEQGLLYDNGLKAMVALHALDWRQGFGFLERKGSGSALDRHIEHVAQWHQWSSPSLRFNPDIIAAALDYVRSHRPPDAEEVCVTWGDARVGNMIFNDNLSVAALLDWEGASLGPAAMDVAWWLMFEDFFSVEQNTPRLPGVPGPEETLARYRELSGREIPDILYYQVLAGLTFALINSRLADLYISNYGADPKQATAFIDRTTRMIAAWLAKA